MDFTLKNLNRVSVHGLRNIARELGVKAPSTLNKSTLIKEIIDIKSGNKQPYSLSKKGRPPKASYCIQNFERKIENVPVNQNKLKNKEKRRIIKSILQEIEKKLNEIL